MSQVLESESNRRKQTTLKDIADVVGVSINAVSSVLNPRKVPARVSPVTRELILETARKLDYRRNAVSRRVCSKRTFTLGILMEDLTNSFSTSIVNAFDAEANTLGYLCFVGFSNPGIEDRFQQVKRYVDRGMDGMTIVASPYDRKMEAVIRFATNSSLPIIFTNHRTGRFVAPMVGGNHFQGGLELGRTLLNKGHRRFVQLVRTGEARSSAIIRRIEGLRQALMEANLEPKALQVVTIDHDTELNDSIFENFPVDFVPSVLLASNDFDAFQLIITLKKCNIDVPGNVAVTGYDIDKNRPNDPIQWMNNPLLSSAVSLTTIRQSSAEYGRQAARLLIDIINQKQETSIDDILLDVDIIQGKSDRLPEAPDLFADFLQGYAHPITPAEEPV